MKHELTAEVRALAERAVAAISPTLRLVNVKEATSMVSCLHTVLQVIVGSGLFQPFYSCFTIQPYAVVFRDESTRNGLSDFY